MLTAINRTALVVYSAQQMFDLVNDVACYPEYMKNCVGAKILKQDKSFMLARLDLKKGFLQQSFTTHNTLYEPERISMTLDEGPFSKFLGEWSFKALNEDACKVSLDLEFEFNNFSVSLASNQLFTLVANNLVDALACRAKEVYG
ncbi:MAG: type II toxin-antitoxin system RatA family toxin [Pseudomonadales bacterium]|jgi:ribosome-associated toxin RatA of RatAB toxin-antitoxin module